MTAWTAVTTCSVAQWTAFGRAMVATFERHWPRDIQLWFYVDAFQGHDTERVRFLDLNQSAAWFARWKEHRTPEQHGKTTSGYKYRWDAVKFAHKVAAIGTAAETIDGGLIWIDADIITHAPVTAEWLENLLPVDADIGWLDRDRYYPECGFLMFRLPQAAPIIRRIVAAYINDSIFRMAEWHDSFVIETVVKTAVKLGQIKVASLSGAGRAHHHVLANSPIGERLDHLKGGRKIIGRTPKHERVVAGGGPYWS